MYELIGIGVARSPFEATAARGLTRFVGRDAELEQLHRALERSEAGEGQVVGVMGEPGVGKTRLFYEFLRQPLSEGWLILATNAASYGKSVPYLPVNDLLRAYFKIDVRDTMSHIHEKVQAKAALEPELEPLLPGLLALLDVPVHDPVWQRLDPPQRRAR